MKSKKKLIIAITSLSIALVAAVVAVVAIFAAQNQNVRSTLTVKYTAVDVSATVRANYIVGATKTAMLTEDDKEELVFLPTSEEGGTLTPQDENIELNTQDNSVVFEYIFTNDSNSIDVAIDLDTTGFSVNNMTLSYAYSYTEILDTVAMPTTESFEPMMILGEAKEGGAYETLYVYVKATVINLANDASFEGTMDFSLTKATPVKLTFENITDATNAVLLQTRIIPANTNIDSLPAPTFASGERYAWFVDSALETMVSYSFTASEDMTVYAGIQPYAVTVSADGKTTTIENLTEDAIYLTTATSASFGFGSSRTLNTNGSYILVDEGQTVSVSSGTGASNVNIASPVSSSNAVKSVLLNAPEDLEEKMFYAAYGAYPQTYVGNALNEELKNANLTKTGNVYRMEGYSYLYGSVEWSDYWRERVVECEEFLYNGKKYVKVESARSSTDYVYGYDPEYGGNTMIEVQATFLSGEEYTAGESYFFEVEPIVAKAMEKNENGTFTMQSVKMLFRPLDQSVEEATPEWSGSNIREFMNDTFLNDSGLSDIAVETEVLNNDGYNGDFSDGTYTTTDKIWMVSLEEFLNWGGYEYDSTKVDGGYYMGDCSTSYFSYGDHTDFLVATGGVYLWEGKGGFMTRTSGIDFASCQMWVYHNEFGLSGSQFNLGDLSYHPVFAVNI